MAYANSFAGASSTTLFDIDIASQKLFMQDPPNDGKLAEVGPLGIAPTDDGGFDISPMIIRPRFFNRQRYESIVSG